MKKLIKKLPVALVSFCLFAAAIEAQTYTLEQTAIAGGGMSGGAGGTYNLSSTTGQAAAGGAIRGTPYAMTVGFWNFTPSAPTAANVSIGGRVTTANGQGIRNARLVLVNGSGAQQTAQTASFGYYRFDDLRAGETYVLTVYSKRYVFAEPTRIISLSDDLTDVNFTSEP